MGSKKNIIVFDTVDKDDKPIKLAVKRPDVKNMIAGQDVYSSTYRKAVENGDFFRDALERHLIEQDIWGEDKQKQLDAYIKLIDEQEKILAKGNIKKSDAKTIAIAIKLARRAQNELLSERNQYSDNTVEGKAENAKFNYWVSVCTVYNDSGEPYFRSLEDYLNRADEQASYDAAQNLATLIYGLDSDYESKLPENKFLKHFGYVNDKGEFINEDGKRTDILGRLLDDEGNYVDDTGEKIFDKEVELDFDSFLDDEPAEPEDKPDEVDKPQTKRGRPKKTEVPVETATE